MIPCFQKLILEENLCTGPNTKLAKLTTTVKDMSTQRRLQEIFQNISNCMTHGIVLNFQYFMFKWFVLASLLGHSHQPYAQSNEVPVPGICRETVPLLWYLSLPSSQIFIIINSEVKKMLRLTS